MGLYEGVKRKKKDLSVSFNIKYENYNQVVQAHQDIHDRNP